MRILKITTNDGCVFYSSQWRALLVDSLERQAEERHGGVQSMELVLMTQEEYNSIPATKDSAQLFAVDPHSVRGGE